ncbi:uncharacterized protein PAC_08964 [Phialocephala subalpina]|uniref:Heterokaryon incompatibility domain-containing protein n=1 Tax=Phialocephala subalpina TaxID=576137 RepID=A0A1L7X240_9HELO|nr:uncharacterized protein PAC_08964 [Phialocephala subalpina]
MEPFLTRESPVNDPRIEGRDISTEIGSGQSLAWIQQCLEACNSGEEDHKTCLNHADHVGHAGQRPDLPKRVLDLSFSNEEDGDVHLKINTTGHLRGRYAALSHRWDNETKPIITTTENVDAHISRIPFSDLSASFQDAVRPCRQLSVPYLWTDTLCIIQDSLADWANQSVKMAQIYTNAYLTLAFSCAWNSQCQILTSRPPVQTLRLGGKYSHVHLRCTEDNLEFFWQGSKKGVLYRLTRFERLLQDQYVAGLWRVALPKLLPWMLNDISIDRPKNYRAPSWSWAAHDGGILFKGTGKNHAQLPNPRDVVLVDIYVENTGRDEFGPVKDSWMSVRGFCFKLVHRMSSIILYRTGWSEHMQFRGHVDVLAEFEEGRLYDRPDGVEFTLLQVSRWRIGKEGDNGSKTYPIACLMLTEEKGCL